MDNMTIFLFGFSTDIIFKLLLPVFARLTANSISIVGVGMIDNLLCGIEHVL
jgi:hypothetical protein